MLTSPYPLSSFTTTSDPSAEAGAIVAGIVVVIFYLAIAAFGIYMYMRLAKKAGWTLWHGLLVLVPLANAVFMIMFVFMEWPIERRLREAEARLTAAGIDPQPFGGYPPGYAQPTGYGQPSGYGQPAPYAQPAGYGQVDAYGRPTDHGQVDPYAAPADHGTPTIPPPAPPAPEGSSPWQAPGTTPPR